MSVVRRSRSRPSDEGRVVADAEEDIRPRLAEGAADAGDHPALAEMLQPHRVLPLGLLGLPGSVFFPGFFAAGPRRGGAAGPDHGFLENVLDVLDKDELDVADDLLRDLVEVLLVRRRHDHLLDPGALGGQDLLLDPADGQDVAAQGDLPGHGHVPLDLDVRADGEEGGGDGDAGRRPVLGDGPFGKMDVEVVLGEDLAVDAELRGVGPGVAQGRLGGLLHDVAEGAGERQLPLARHLGRLDEEDLAARRPSRRRRSRSRPGPS